MLLPPGISNAAIGMCVWSDERIVAARRSVAASLRVRKNAGDLAVGQRRLGALIDLGEEVHGLVVIDGRPIAQALGEHEEDAVAVSITDLHVLLDDALGAE